MEEELLTSKEGKFKYKGCFRTPELRQKIEILNFRVVLGL